MKNKRKLKITAISLAALAVVGIGAFAFFSDDAEDEEQGEIGSVDIAVDDALTLENKENINPGDDDPDNPNLDTGTTSHKLSFSIENDGTKSVYTRNIIDIDVTAYYKTTTDSSGNVVLARDDDGNYIPLTEEEKPVYLDPTVFSLYARTYKGADGREGNYDIADMDGKQVYKFTYDFTDDGGNEGVMLRYVIEGATLNGSVIETHDSTTEDDDTVVMEDKDGIENRKVSYTYYLGMDSTATNIYQSSETTIHLYVQAMQWRNTAVGSYADDGDWITVYEDVIVCN